MQFDVHLRRTRDKDAPEESANLLELLKGFFGTSGVSLREIAQAIHRLGFVLASLGSDQKCFFTAATVALILRTLDLDLYRRFVHGAASDRDVVERVTKRFEGLELRGTYYGQVFERTLIIGYVELKLGERFELFFQSNHTIPPLLEKYRNIVKECDEREQSGAERTGDQPDDSECDHARRVVTGAEVVLGRPCMRGARVGFASAVRRIELISSEFVTRGSG